MKKHGLFSLIFRHCLMSDDFVFSNNCIHGKQALVKLKNKVEKVDFLFLFHLSKTVDLLTG